MNVHGQRFNRARPWGCVTILEDVDLMLNTALPQDLGLSEGAHVCMMLYS